jgi:hypothetical protein
MEVAIDSNALTYLVEAMEPNYDPANDDPSLAVERISMLRTFLYTGTPFYVLPQVRKEYNKIPRYEWRNIHESTVGVLLEEIFIENQDNGIKKRKTEFMSFHPKNKDCQILAEAEAMNMSSLLTRDNNFINRLSPRTTIQMVYPSEFWNNLNIVSGAELKTFPLESNPLFGKSWWKI